MKEPLLSTTAFGFEGYHVARHLGLVRGIIVRSRSIVGNIGAALQTIVGGNISIYTNLCERARQDACDALCEHARALGAKAVIGVTLRCHGNRGDGICEIDLTHDLTIGNE
jgi:uncharacterized protein YbjQ (UPF0145 family)